MTEPYVMPTTIVSTLEGGPVLVMCEPVGEHLAIVPKLSANYTLTGRWHVSHNPTRLRLPGMPACLPCARRAAQLALICGIDWAEAGLGEWWTKERQELVQPAREALNSCFWEDCYADD